MGQALYRTYRSKSLDEIVGQSHIIDALKHAAKTSSISHAYLFTGPRGTGKTSIARIWAHQVNGIPYSTSSNLDIIEIDAASNRRIDEVRDLREKVHIAPSSLKYKVYIIDEVHMLTKEAFNALLKTLEEPPAHALFILATTDAHKLPATIISRTQRYTFKPIAHEKVVSHLKHIALSESIAIDDDALQLIAEHGQGSMRDSTSILDQMRQRDHVTADAVREHLGVPNRDALQLLVETLTSHDASGLISQLDTLYENGSLATNIASSMSAFIRSGIIKNKPVLSGDTSLALLEQLLGVATSPNPERQLELALLHAVTMPNSAVHTTHAVDAPVHSKTPPAMPAKKTAAPKTSEITPTTPPKQPVAKEAVTQEPVTQPVIEDITPKPTPTGSQSIDDESWKQVLVGLKKQYNTLYGIVRMATTDFSQPGKVTLGFTFVFHQKRIQDPKNRAIISEIIQNETGQAVELACVIIEKNAPSQPADPAKALNNVSSVFGGGELL